MSKVRFVDLLFHYQNKYNIFQTFCFEWPDLGIYPSRFGHFSPQQSSVEALVIGLLYERPPSENPVLNPIQTLHFYFSLIMRMQPRTLLGCS